MTSPEVNSTTPLNSISLNVQRQSNTQEKSSSHMSNSIVKHVKITINNHDVLPGDDDEGKIIKQEISKKGNIQRDQYKNCDINNHSEETAKKDAISSKVIDDCRVALQEDVTIGQDEEEQEAEEEDMEDDEDEDDEDEDEEDDEDDDDASNSPTFSRSSTTTEVIIDSNNHSANSVTAAPMNATTNKSNNVNNNGNTRNNRTASPVTAGSNLRRAKNDSSNRSVSSQSTSSSGTDGTDIVKLSRSKDSPTLTSKKLIALFIGDLDEKVTEKNLRDTFNKFDSFVSAKICIDSNTKKSLGYGYLNFSNEYDAERVIEEFNYIPIFGREVRIMPSLRNSFYRKNIGTNVFFSNLPLENLALTTRVFYNAFKKYGKILSCKLDRRKNIGFVYFEKDSSAKQAISEYNGKEFYGNNILCGIHFDRNVRKSPEFEKRKARLEDMTLIKESLIMDNNQEIPSGSKMKGPHPNAVFIKNLPLNPDSDLLLDFFSQVGPVKSIFTSNVSKLNSSWAFITFKKGSDAQDAINNLNHCQLLGRTIELSRAQKNFQNDIDSVSGTTTTGPGGTTMTHGKLLEIDSSNSMSPNGIINTSIASASLVSAIASATSNLGTTGGISSSITSNSNEFIASSTFHPQHHHSGNHHSGNHHNHHRGAANGNSSYKLTVYLSSLSSICSEQFLQCFCAEERIKTKRISIRHYEEDTLTFAGFVQCQTRNDANRLFELLNDKLLGDSTVRASWKPPKEFKQPNSGYSNHSNVTTAISTPVSINHQVTSPALNSSTSLSSGPDPSNSTPSSSPTVTSAPVKSPSITTSATATGNTANSAATTTTQKQKPSSAAITSAPSSTTNSRSPNNNSTAAASSNTIVSPSMTPNSPSQLKLQNQNQNHPPHHHSANSKKASNQVNIRREPYIYRAPAPEYRGYNPLKNKMLQQQVLMAPLNVKPPVVKDPNAKETLVALKKEVRRYIDFLKFPLATREQNLSIISKYILEVFYQNKIEAITRVLLMKQNHNYFERQFQEQVEESIAQLGLEGR